VADLQPLLEKNRVVVIHRNIDNWVETVICDLDSDDKEISTFTVEWVNDPQKRGAVITYGRRYNLASLFNIIADKDDDWESFYNRKQEAKQETKPAKKEFWEKEYKQLVEKKSDYVDALWVFGILDDKWYTISKEREQKIKDLFN
jgi:cobalamin biosynthesis Mg chelatase CobN